jgi:hypothetical protein
VTPHEPAGSGGGCGIEFTVDLPPETVPIFRGKIRQPIEALIAPE